MPISVRLNPDLEKKLAAACRRERKTRSALIHEALVAYLAPKQPNLGEALAAVLTVSPKGLGIEREQPPAADPRDWAA